MDRYTRMRPRSLTAEAIAVRRLRSGEYRGQGAGQLDGALVSSPCTSGSGDGSATAPQALPPRGDGRRTIGEMRAA